MLPALRLAVAAGLLCLAACGRGPDPVEGASRSPAGSPPDAAASATDASPSPTSAPGGDAIADAYACDAGTRLTRQDDGSFRAEIPGNAPVRLARIAGSAPPVFTGASLYLRIEGSGVAILSQGDRTNELRCATSNAPA